MWPVGGDTPGIIYQKGPGTGGRQGCILGQGQGQVGVCPKLRAARKHVLG